MDTFKEILKTGVAIGAGVIGYAMGAGAVKGKYLPVVVGGIAAAGAATAVAWLWGKAAGAMPPKAGA